MATVTDYTTLTAAKSTDGSIKSWVDHDSIPAPTIVAMAEQYMWRRLRVRQMLTSTTGTIAKGDTALALPSDYLIARSLRLTGDNAGEMTRRLPEDVEARRWYDDSNALVEGIPQVFYTDDANAVFEVTASQQLNYRLLYYKQPEALSGNNPSNFLTDRGFRAFLGALLGFAYEWLQEPEQMNRWLQVAQQESNVLNNESGEEQGWDLHAPAFAE